MPLLKLERWLLVLHDWNDVREDVAKIPRTLFMAKPNFGTMWPDAGICRLAVTNTSQVYRAARITDQFGINLGQEKLEGCVWTGSTTRFHQKQV